MPDPESHSPEASTPVRASPGRWLAIETAGLHGSLAAGEATEAGCTVVESLSLPTDARSARTLAPALDALLKRLGWPPASLSAIAVAIGPGSFTGLRVGVATAKTLAYATQTAILGIDTLDALAEAAQRPATTDAGLWTVLDAQRQELFAAHYQAEADGWRRDERTQRISRQALADYAKPTERVVGPVAGTLTVEAECVAANPTAEAVLRVAHQRWLAGEADSVFALVPQYHRLSAAEENAVDR